MEEVRPGICPECAVNKHSICVSWAYDSEDQEGPCLCEMYGHDLK